VTVPFSSVAGVELVVGACTASSAKIGVCSLRGGTITVSGISGGVSVSAWADMGADNSAEAGKHVCSVATVTLSTLAPFTRHSGVLTCDGVSIEFSFRTHPTETEPYRFLMWSCERMTDVQYIGRGPWRSVKAEIEASGPPVLFTACIDDPNYAQLVDAIEDAESGLAPVGYADDSELEWDYAVAWCMWYGLIRGDTECRQSTYPDRLWVRHNCSHLVIWGDNEVSPNHGRDADAGQDRKIPRAEPWWSAARDCYLRFCADACSPAYLGEAADTGYGWGFRIGDCAFVSPDCNSFIMPYNAEDEGDTHLYGRANHATSNAGGGATVPLRSEVNDQPYAPPVCYGVKQCDAMLKFLAEEPKPLNVLFSPNGIAFDNEPMHERWPDEFDYLFARGKEFLIDGDFIHAGAHWTAKDEDTTIVGYHVDRTYQNGLEVKNGAADRKWISQQLSGLIPGQEYTLSGHKIGGSNRVKVGTAADDGSYLNELVEAGTGVAFSYTFTPVIANPVLTLSVGSSTLDTVARWDKVSVTGPGGVEGLLISDGTNGVDGCLVILKGDTHACRVIRYVANGSNGLCNAALDDVELWEVNPGTLTGSGSHRDATGATISAGGQLRFEQQLGAGVTGTGRVSTFAVGTVRDATLDIAVYNNFMGGIVWRGVFAAGSNAPTYPRPRIAA